MISPHTSCSLTGLALCEAYQDLGVDTLIMHDAPRTQSTHFHRIVSENYGTGRFKGKVRIPENSLKSEASQMCRIVLLGQRGRITAEPTLDIVADDVSIFKTGLFLVLTRLSSLYYT
jgi:Fe-S cluster assembly scaffold protein SufB